MTLTSSDICVHGIWMGAHPWSMMPSLTHLDTRMRKSLSTVLFALAACFYASAPLFAAESGVLSSGKSSVIVNPATALADNTQRVSVLVTLLDEMGAPMIGEEVRLISARPGTDVVSEPVRTDGLGKALFSIRSPSAGPTTVLAYVGLRILNNQPLITFIEPVCPFPAGRLVKTEDHSAVYYYGRDCQRHAFPNERVFFTWYDNFQNVVTVSANEMAGMALGKNVLYRPGVRLVKFTTDARVYAVLRGGTLRWVGDESLARILYGETWSRQIDDLSDAFYGDYEFGSAIDRADAYLPANETANTPTIDYNL